MQTSPQETTEPKKSCFNYCLFSKALVALPALSVVAYIPTTMFDSPAMQITGAVVAVGLAIYAAIWLDRIPLLQKKIGCGAKCESSKPA